MEILNLFFIQKKKNLSKKNWSFIFKRKIFLIILLLIFSGDNVIKYLKKINILKNKIKNYIKIYDDSDYKIFLIKQNVNLKFNNKKLIHISMALDNRNIYPTLISIVSALENNNKEKNLLVYHLLLSYNFLYEKINIFESLKNNYEFSIDYYMIPKIFFNFKRWTGGTDCHYYKLLIPVLFKDLERLLYLDGDTLIYKDLLELYNLPLFNNYILAPPSPIHDLPKKFKLKDNIYINVGVILFNIKKIKDDKKDFDLLFYASKYNHLFSSPEQDLINYVYRGKICFLPFKYGIFLYGNITTFKKFHSHKYKYLKSKDIIEAINEPTIVHLVYCVPKVWNKKTKSIFGVDFICKYYQKEFYYFAKKTNYYYEIFREYIK